MNPKLLIVDDDEEIRTQMKWALAQAYDVALAESRATAVEAFRTLQPMVVLLDLGLPPNPNSPEEGLATLSELLGLNPLVRSSSFPARAKRKTPSRPSVPAPTIFSPNR